MFILKFDFVCVFLTFFDPFLRFLYYFSFSGPCRYPPLNKKVFLKFWLNLKFRIIFLKTSLFGFLVIFALGMQILERFSLFCPYLSSRRKNRYFPPKIGWLGVHHFFFKLRGCFRGAEAERAPFGRSCP